MSGGRTEGGIFNIGSQHGEAVFGAVDPGRELRRLRVALAATELPAPARREADSAMADVETELAATRPDRGRIGARLGTAAAALRDAGALAAAGASLVEPLSRLAAWLGPAGQSIGHLLG